MQRSLLRRPWKGSGALRTAPPFATASAWCPRHTPSTGMQVPLSSSSAHTPTSAARSGVPGPGEMTTLPTWPARTSRRMSAYSISSLRNTSGARPCTAAMRCSRLYVYES